MTYCGVQYVEYTMVIIQYIYTWRRIYRKSATQIILRRHWLEMQPSVNITQGLEEGGEGGAESTEWLIDDQAFLRSYGSAPRPSPYPLAPQQVVSLSLSSCVSPVELTDEERWGRGLVKNQILLQRESLGLYKSFNPHWGGVCYPVK